MGARSRKEIVGKWIVDSEKKSRDSGGRGARNEEHVVGQRPGDLVDPDFSCRNGTVAPGRNIHHSNDPKETASE